MRLAILVAYHCRGLAQLPMRAALEDHVFAWQRHPRSPTTHHNIATDLVLMVVGGNAPSVRAIILMPRIVPSLQFVASVGIGFAALPVFVHDFWVLPPTLLMALLLASPILYPLVSVPVGLRDAALWNPFYLPAELVRQPLVHHRLLPRTSWAYPAVVTLVIGSINLRIFRRVRGTFSSMP
jgi:ABC-type polysaccharide/polyol phosphate export permease